MNRSLMVWTMAALALVTETRGAETKTELKEARLEKEVAASVSLFKKTDPKMEKLFKSAPGYAVYSGIGKGAFGIGAAYGEGEVFAAGRKIGRTSLTQVTIGFQLGGQAYDEVIFFETKEALEQFTAGKLALSAQVSAVAAAEGASANAKYQQGVMVFTMAKGGLMYEASVGGQKFKFFPLKR